MKNKFYITTNRRSPQNFSQKFPQKFPWSKIILSFLMIGTFLILATTGTNSTETVANWTENIGKIIIGTAIFSIATILLVWAGRIPRNSR